eukprot:GHUV01005093.1.p1 GENE.GHUV01005093.1~~GHUV01005093.1.p1  ORF type:complete len:101 (-),score=17.19 GHUV01005093.1:630-932(-)
MIAPLRQQTPHGQRLALNIQFIGMKQHCFVDMKQCCFMSTAPSATQHQKSAANCHRANIKHSSIHNALAVSHTDHNVACSPTCTASQPRINILTPSTNEI